MRTKGKIFSGKFGLILTAGLATFVVVGLFLAQGANAGEQISDSSGLPIFYADRTIANLTINTVKITSPKNPVEPGKKFRLEGIIRPDLTANTRAKAACAWPEWGPEIKRHNSGWLGCDTIYKDTVGENSSEFSIELEAPDKPGIYRIDLYVQRTMPVYFAVVQMIDGHVSIEVGGGSTPNKSPAMPSCSVSPASNFTGEEFTIKAKSADPDGDKIKYNFSFDNAETFDAPFSGYVGSNTELSVAKRWDVAGVKSIKIKAIDERGGESGWTSCSAEVKDPPPKNNPPATPSCEVSPAEGPTTTSFSIKAKSTDPDGDTLKYEFAFDGNFSLPVTKPSSGYVQSGAEQSTTKQWTTEGAKQIQIRAIDLKGAASGWASCSASVKNPVDETGDRTVTPPPPPPPWVGGWDGWIKMSGKTDGGESYGVRYDPDTTRFCGYAWGGNVVGWVKFGPLPEEIPGSKPGWICDQTRTVDAKGIISAPPYRVIPGTAGTQEYPVPDWVRVENTAKALIDVEPIEILISPYDDTIVDQLYTLTGWAWSSNIGWISMSSTTIPQGGVDYGVRMRVGKVTGEGANRKENPSERSLIGYAWSSNIGWVKFDAVPYLFRDPEGTPGRENYPEPRLTSDDRLKPPSWLNTNSNLLGGWARICVATKGGDCNSPTGDYQGN